MTSRALTYYNIADLEKHFSIIDSYPTLPGALYAMTRIKGATAYRVSEYEWAVCVPKKVQS